MVTKIKRWIETDTGHRVPNHKSKCRHFHGHRYRWEVVIEGEVVSQEGVSEEGMLMDFSDISNILNREIHDIVDHSFLVYENDLEAINALNLLGNQHRTLILPFIPTAENLARWAFEKVEKHIESSYNNKLRLISFNVRETPKSWASWTPYLQKMNR